VPFKKILRLRYFSDKGAGAI